jgi:dihydrofolate reductase
VAKLVYSVLCSLDGYVADAQGSFDWAEPDEDVHTFVNELARSVGTYLLGRRMYEVLVAWETIETANQPAHIREFAELWHRADKVVYSTTLQEVSSANTRIERTFDPGEVRRWKETSDRDLSVGGPGLAGDTLRAGLVDECQLFLAPIAVGGGTPVFPIGDRVVLELLDQRRFANGTMFLRYRSGG